MIEEHQGKMIDKKFYKGEMIKVFGYNDFTKEFIIDCSTPTCDIYEYIPYKKATIYAIDVYDLGDMFSYE